MTTQELVDKIGEWEINAGESFNDCFMHDNVKDGSWAFWLIGKGFTEHGNKIILDIIKDKSCIDQETLYEIYPEYVDDNGQEQYNEENYLKNIALAAEFLLATPYYTEIVLKFLRK